MGAPRLLGIYLNDHLAGADAALVVAGRCRSANEDNEYGRFLTGFIGEVEEDRATLLAVMAHLEVRPDILKRTAVRALGQAGRLKLNGRIGSYSPLSRLEELETLCLGVEGKLALWRALREAEKDLIDLAGFDFDGLAARAQGQRKALEDLRLSAAKTALASD